MGPFYKCRRYFFSRIGGSQFKRLHQREVCSLAGDLVPSLCTSSSCASLLLITCLMRWGVSPNKRNITFTRSRIGATKALRVDSLDFILKIPIIHFILMLRSPRSQKYSHCVKPALKEKKSNTQVAYSRIPPPITGPSL